MNSYELLENEACEEGIEIIDYDFKSENIKGLYCDNAIAISSSVASLSERTSILAEELGHYHTSVGDILDQTDTSNRKQERRARLWAYDKLVGLSGIIKGFESCCQSRYELAECLGVTEMFLQEAIDCYVEKYGTCVEIDGYLILFTPTLGVIKKF